MKNELKTNAEWQTILTEKDNEIAQLRGQVEWLSQQFRLMQARQFGRSSEKCTVIPEQLSLFNEAEAIANPDVPEPDIEKITYTRKKHKGKRETDFSGLPTERIIHELPESERVCPDCGGEHRGTVLLCG